MRDSTPTGTLQALQATDRVAGQRAPARGLRRAVHALAALGVVLLLAACSSLRLGYNNADTLLVYSLDSYLDLDDAQEDLARERVRELLAWHRSTQLQAYARFLDDTERKIGSGPIGADDVLVFQQAVSEKLMRVGEQAAPDLARLALTLTPVQMDQFADRLARDGAEARREFLTNAGRQTLDDRVQAYAERAQGWLGSLSKEQLEMVGSALAAGPSGPQLWLEERERRQRDLVALLGKIVDERPSELVAADWLRAYFAQLAQPSEEARRARVQENRRNNAQLIAQLINTATPAQKAVLARKLRGYAQDFDTLASAVGARG
jgi:hypothetical protein